MRELLRESATALATRIRDRDVSPGGLALTALERAEEVNALGAFSFIDADGALAAAGEARGANEPPFAGVPTAIKDMSDQAGLPCWRGSYAFRSCAGNEDALGGQLATKAQGA